MRAGTRGQTTQDFAVGISVFLLTIAFVFAFIPTIFTPFDTDVGGSDTSNADRVASTFIENHSVEGKLGTLDADTARAFFSAGGNGDGLRDRYSLSTVTRINVTVRSQDGSIIRNATGDPTGEYTATVETANAADDGTDISDGGDTDSYEYTGDGATASVATVDAASDPSVNYAYNFDGSEADPSSLSGAMVAYVDSGTVHITDEGGETIDTGVSAQLVGSVTDIDDDGTVEVPAVDGSNNLMLVEPDGSTETLANNAAYSKTTIAVGDYDEDGTRSVIYKDTNSYISRVEPDESPVQVTTSTQTNGIAGYGDFTGDGAGEIVFIGTSAEIKYYDGSVGTTGFSDVSSNNGLGFGALADYDGDGTERVPVVDGSQQIALIDSSGTKETLADGYSSATYSPLGGANVSGDSQLDVLFRDSSGEIHYAEVSDSSSYGPFEPDGSGITADTGAGVAGTGLATLDASAPNVTSISLDNDGSDNLDLSFETDEQLGGETANLTVTVDGPSTTDVYTFDRDEFSESGSGPYTYALTTTQSFGDGEGTYTATVDTAEDSNGNDGASGESDSYDFSSGAAIRNVALSEDDGDLALSFDADEELGDDTDDIDVTVDGPNTDDVYTFDRDEFSETDNGDGTYTYELTATQAYDDTGTGSDIVRLARGDNYDGQPSASTSRVVTFDEDICSPTCRLVVRVW